MIDRRSAIYNVLRFPLGVDWTVQGFGMIRCYFGEDKRYRLNIWDSALKAPGASMIHDHPWHFESQVIAGELRNYRYHEDPLGVFDSSKWYQWGILTPGTGWNGGITPGGIVSLARQPVEVYKPFHAYSQRRREIHETDYMDGTVTVNDRLRPVGGQDLARVYWLVGEEWGDAKPRASTPEEIERTTEKALELLP